MLRVCVFLFPLYVIFSTHFLLLHDSTSGWLIHWHRLVLDCFTWKDQPHNVAFFFPNFRRHHTLRPYVRGCGITYEFVIVWLEKAATHMHALNLGFLRALQMARKTCTHTKLPAEHMQTSCSPALFWMNTKFLKAEIIKLLSKYCI